MTIAMPLTRPRGVDTALIEALRRLRRRLTDWLRGCRQRAARQIVVDPVDPMSSTGHEDLGHRRLAGAGGLVHVQHVRLAVVQDVVDLSVVAPDLAGEGNQTWVALD